MYEIKEEVLNTFIEKKSKFICRLFKVNSEEEAKNKIKQIENLEKGATHNCYAYRIYDKNGLIERKSDDREPSGTAGIPMLSLLEQENLINILAITTRYFGGIKLGASGLVKAYKKSVSQALKLTEKVDFIQKEEIKIKFDIKNTKIIDNILKRENIEIKDKKFSGTEVEYIIKFPKKENLDLKNMLNSFITILK